jgi:hypothetical protein
VPVELLIVLLDTDVSNDWLDADLDPSVTDARVLIDGEYYFPKSCYTCKTRFYKPHDFYDRVCLLLVLLLLLASEQRIASQSRLICKLPMPTALSRLCVAEL